MNTCSYNLFFSYDINVSATMIEFVVKEVQPFKLSPVNPDSGEIHIMQADGLESHQFAYLPEAIEWLTQNGGVMDFWRGQDFDLGIGFERQSDRTLCKIGIGISEIHFRRNASIDRLKTEEEIQQIYVALCNGLKPVYGYSACEDVEEYFFDEVKELSESIRKLKRPPLLFWLSYFSDEYAASIGSDIFQELGGAIVSLSNGILVSFFSHLWESDIAELETIRKQWLESP